MHDLGGGAARAVGSSRSGWGLGDQRGQGVSVRSASARRRSTSRWWSSTASRSRRSPTPSASAIKRVEGITGLSVTEVNIGVNDLYFPGDEQPEEESRVS